MERRSSYDLPAPVPTASTLWWRRFLPWQLLRFVVVNVRMLRMIGLSHPHKVPPQR